MRAARQLGRTTRRHSLKIRRKRKLHFAGPHPILLNIFCPVHYRAYGLAWLEAGSEAVGTGISSGPIVSEAVEPGGLPRQGYRVDAELIVTQVRSPMLQAC